MHKISCSMHLSYLKYQVAIFSLSLEIIHNRLIIFWHKCIYSESVLNSLHVYYKIKANKKYIIGRTTIVCIPLSIKPQPPPPTPRPPFLPGIIFSEKKFLQNQCSLLGFFHSIAISIFVKLIHKFMNV